MLQCFVFLSSLPSLAFVFTSPSASWHLKPRSGPPNEVIGNKLSTPTQSRDNPPTLFYVYVSRKGFCRNPRGVFLNEFLGEFCRGFLVDFGGPLSLEKQEKNIHPKIQGKIQIRIWERPKSILQESALDFVFFLSLKMGSDTDGVGRI